MEYILYLITLNIRAQILHRPRGKLLGNLVSDDLTILCFICQINSSFEYGEFRFRKDVFSLVNNYRGPEYFFVSSLPITRATIIEYM